MNYFLLGLALLGCACVVQADLKSATIETLHIPYTPIRERTGHFYEARRRTGHFKAEPFIDLYKTYASAFVTPLYPGRPLDDYRNYVPSGDECMVFFQQFRNDEYTLRGIEAFIVLDACLGYLYESPDHDKDSADSVQVRDSLPGYKEDPKLQELYEKTKIDDLNEEAKSCIGDLFLDSVRAKKQFSDVVCNNHWLNLLNNFAACQKKNIDVNWRDEDSYGKVIYELVRTHGNECFQNEITALNSALRNKYANNPFRRVNNILRSPFSSLHSQAKDRAWPREVVELLSAVQGTKQEINLREVSGIVRGVALNNANFKKRLLNNMAKYAQTRINPKQGSKATQQDPTGDARYTLLVDNVCAFFRQSDNPAYYDFSTPFLRMVRMLEFPEIFGITEEQFVTDVLTHSVSPSPSESSALYLCVSSCNILSYTQGHFVRGGLNAPLNYEVKFKSNIHSMVQWPNAGYY